MLTKVFRAEMIQNHIAIFKSKYCMSKTYLVRQFSEDHFPKYTFSRSQFPVCPFPVSQFSEFQFPES
jgi:hypothetical protein